MATHMRRVEKQLQPLNQAAVAHWRDVITTWDTLIENAKPVLLCLQDDEQRALARKLKVPYVAVKIICRELTVEDLAEWRDWGGPWILLSPPACTGTPTRRERE